MGKSSVRVMVFADVRLYREGLSHLLSGRDGLSLVGAAPSTSDSMELAATSAPDVVLVEAAAACTTTIVQDLASLVPNARVVAYGMLDEEKQAMRCAEVGVAAFVPSEATSEELVEAVLGLGRGEFRCSPRVSALLVKHVSALSRAGVRPDPSQRELTPRERSIVALIEQGLSNKEIAAHLGIGVSTVKNHVHNILDKLQATRRTQAAARFRRGIASPSSSRRTKDLDPSI